MPNLFELARFRVIAYSSYRDSTVYINVINISPWHTGLLQDSIKISSSFYKIYCLYLSSSISPSLLVVLV